MSEASPLNQLLLPCMVHEQPGACSVCWERMISGTMPGASMHGVIALCRTEDRQRR